MKPGFIILFSFSGLVMLAGLMLVGRGMMLKAENISPKQPISFDHTIHVEKAGLACNHCHVYADKGPRATVPAMSVCMKCHEKMDTKNPEILKLKEYFNKGEVVKWLKVHKLPAHVRFTHKRHVRAGVECATCHGDVGEMKQIRRVRTFDMGFCVSCHADNKATMDCIACHK